MLQVDATGIEEEEEEEEEEEGEEEFCLDLPRSLFLDIHRRKLCSEFFVSSRVLLVSPTLYFI
jgi:hypothetical protein